MTDMEEIIENALDDCINECADTDTWEWSGRVAQALLSSGYGKVQAKKLEWKERASRSGKSGKFYRARTLFGRYLIHHRENGIAYVDQSHAGGWVGKAFINLEAAQAACQSDFEKRLSECMEPAPVSDEPSTVAPQAAGRVPDWWWRDLDPDDAGETPGEAIRNMPAGTVCFLRSSFMGPEKYAVEVPIPHPEIDDTETLVFETEEEALAAAKKRFAEQERLRALPQAPEEGGK